MNGLSIGSFSMQNANSSIFFSFIVPPFWSSIGTRRMFYYHTALGCRCVAAAETCGALSLRLTLVLSVAYDELLENPMIEDSGDRHAEICD